MAASRASRWTKPPDGCRRASRSWRCRIAWLSRLSPRVAAATCDASCGCGVGDTKCMRRHSGPCRAQKTPQAQDSAKASGSLSAGLPRLPPVRNDLLALLEYAPRMPAISWQLTSSLNGAIATVCASLPMLQLSGSPELPRLTWVNGRSQPVELSRWSVTLVAFIRQLTTVSRLPTSDATVLTSTRPSPTALKHSVRSVKTQRSERTSSASGGVHQAGRCSRPLLAAASASTRSISAIAVASNSVGKKLVSEMGMLFGLATRVRKPRPVCRSSLTGVVTHVAVDRPARQGRLEVAERLHCKQLL